MNDKELYAERDIDELGDYYAKHVSAMTTERLHSKSAIAAELAFRDCLIERQSADITNLKALLRAVFEELDDGDGNAPGDSHEKPGILDEDNAPDIAGKPCHWCELWAMVKEVATK